MKKYIILIPIYNDKESLAKLIENIKGFIWDIDEPVFKTIIPEYDKLEIRGETNGKIEDRHYGRYGNFYTALLFDTILEHTNDIEHDGYYIKDLDLISPDSQMLVIKDFAKRNGIEKHLTPFIKNWLLILFRPISFWHNNNPKIKWFEFGNFGELEEWVSNKTGKAFKMEKSNGSQHFECELKLNNEFIKKYNNIYDYYDIQKNNKTLI